MLRLLCASENEGGLAAPSSRLAEIDVDERLGLRIDKEDGWRAFLEHLPLCSYVDQGQLHFSQSFKSRGVGMAPDWPIPDTSCAANVADGSSPYRAQ
jgi:hypothetical protein